MYQDDKLLNKSITALGLGRTKTFQDLQDTERLEVESISTQTALPRTTTNVEIEIVAIYTNKYTNTEKVVG